MDTENRRKLAETLAKADEATIREIVREAEVFLAAQLQAGIASDQRAVTLSAMLAAIIALLIGGAASLVAAKIEVLPHIFPLGILIICLCISLDAAVSAARPTHFDYAGNNPRFWASDIERGRSLTASLAGQASLYAAGIAKNVAVLEQSHGSLRFALKVATGGAIAAVVIEGVILGKLYT